MNGLAVLLAFFFAGQETPPAGHPLVTRTALATLEKGIDSHLAYSADNFDLLGSTRGVYLEGYGAVFSIELNLILSPNVSPFHPAFSKMEIARIRDRKIERLPLLRQKMREMLIASAGSLENVPPSEHVVLAVSLFHYSWEDYSGLPSQIVMQAERQKLLSNATRETAIRTVEF